MNHPRIKEAIAGVSVRAPGIRGGMGDGETVWYWGMRSPVVEMGEEWGGEGDVREGVALCFYSYLPQF